MTLGQIIKNKIVALVEISVEEALKGEASNEWKNAIEAEVVSFVKN